LGGDRLRAGGDHDTALLRYAVAKARLFFDGIFEAARQGLLDIEHVTPERFIRAWRLRLRYRDKPRISFTDLTSFVVMREVGLREALTADAHFEQVGMGLARVP
jgi:predicted nucleic acid-binding protein